MSCPNCDKFQCFCFRPDTLPILDCKHWRTMNDGEVWVGIVQPRLTCRECSLENEIERLRAALQKIAEWDMLNPPQTPGDFVWLKNLVSEALNKEENK